MQFFNYYTTTSYLNHSTFLVRWQLQYFENLHFNYEKICKKI